MGDYSLSSSLQLKRIKTTNRVMRNLNESTEPKVIYTKENKSVVKPECVDTLDKSMLYFNSLTA